VAGASAIYSEGSEFKSRPQDRLYWQVCPDVSKSLSEKL
jgi:hypothetical protein